MPGIKRTNLKEGFKNVVFDCDSTLTFIEGVDEIAKIKGLAEEIGQITHQGMNGEISFAESLYRRLSILKPSRKDIEHLYDRYVNNLVPDSIQLIEALGFLGKEIFIVTGGFQQAVEKLAERLGIARSHVFGVHLKFGKNEDFLGVKENHLTQAGGKARILRKIRRTGPTLFVGDGVTDLTAKDEVDLFVGFGGVVERPVVQKNSAVYVKTNSLAWVLPLICHSREAELVKRSQFKNLYSKGYNILRRQKIPVRSKR